MTNDLYSTAELLDRTFEHEWVLEGLLPAGASMMVHGKRGIGKSLLALATSLCVLNEGRLFGRWPTKKHGSVLYIQADLPPVLHRERIARVAEKMPWVQDGDLYHYCPPYLDIMQWDDSAEELDMLRELEPSFVIWDVLRQVHHLPEATHIPSLVYGQMRWAFPGASHQIYHHDRKTTRDSVEGITDSDEEFSGVGAWSDLVVSVWHLTEVLAHKQWVLETTKNNCGPHTSRIALQRDVDTILPVCRMSELQAEIPRWLGNGNRHRLSTDKLANLRRHLASSCVAQLFVIDKTLGML